MKFILIFEVLVYQGMASKLADRQTSRPRDRQPEPEEVAMLVCSAPENSKGLGASAAFDQSEWNR